MNEKRSKKYWKNDNVWEKIHLLGYPNIQQLTMVIQFSQKFLSVLANRIPIYNIIKAWSKSLERGFHFQLLNWEFSTAGKLFCYEWLYFLSNLKQKNNRNTWWRKKEYFSHKFYVKYYVEYEIFL